MAREQIFEDDPDQYEDWWDEEYLWDEDEEDDFEGVCECGRSADFECDQCGQPLCNMCSEMGANFCSKHPDDDYRPGGHEEPPIIELRIATGEQFAYWNDRKYPRDRVYKRFEKLQYRVQDGEWQDVPRVWLGRID